MRSANATAVKTLAGTPFYPINILTGEVSLRTMISSLLLTSMVTFHSIVYFETRLCIVQLNSTKTLFIRHTIKHHYNHPCIDNLLLCQI